MLFSASPVTESLPASITNLPTPTRTLDMIHIIQKLAGTTSLSPNSCGSAGTAPEMQTSTESLHVWPSFLLIVVTHRKLSTEHVSEPLPSKDKSHLDQENLSLLQRSLWSYLTIRFIVKFLGSFTGIPKFFRKIHRSKLSSVAISSLPINVPPTCVILLFIVVSPRWNSLVHSLVVDHVVSPAPTFKTTL